MASSIDRPDTAIDTRSGRVLDFADPRPDSICLEDIAAGLSMVCRFGGQALAFYSVAQHAVLVKRLVEAAGRPDLALAALHHDDHEAYACDIPKPLKRLIEPYDGVTGRLDVAIATALDLPELSAEDQQVVKEADDEAFEIEKSVFLNVDGRHTDKAPPDRIVVGGEQWQLLSAADAEALFRAEHQGASVSSSQVSG